MYNPSFLELSHLLPIEYTHIPAQRHAMLLMPFVIYSPPLSQAKFLSLD